MDWLVSIQAWTSMDDSDNFFNKNDGVVKLPVSRNYNNNF
jgi:hypothetical protein